MNVAISPFGLLECSVTITRAGSIVYFGALRLLVSLLCYGTLARTDSFRLHGALHFGDSIGWFETIAGLISIEAGETIRVFDSLRCLGTLFSDGSFPYSVTDGRDGSLKSCGALRLNGFSLPLLVICGISSLSAVAKAHTGATIDRHIRRSWAEYLVSRIARPSRPTATTKHSGNQR